MVPSPPLMVEAVMLPPWFGSVELEVEAEIALPTFAVVAERLSAAVGGSGFALTVTVPVPVAETLYAPGVEYVCVPLVPVVVVPSPQLIVEVEPEVLSVVEVTVAVTDSGALPLVGLTDRPDEEVLVETVSVVPFDILFVMDGLPTALTYNV